MCFKIFTCITNKSFVITKADIMSKKILVTAALPYINNVPHMGHIVGSHLPADIFKRCAKSAGYDVALIGGSDEHGTPSVIAAKELGITVDHLVERLHGVHKEIYQKLDISYTNYSRTSNSTHHAEVCDFFSNISNKGFIKEGNVEMFYCENDRMFLPDRFVVGNCPKCGYDAANADQCEKCSHVLLPNTLMEPKCKSCGTTPIVRGSKHLYLDLKKLEGPLLDWITRQRGIWRDHVFSEANKWITEGLKERSITRDLEWGIKVPQKGYEKKVFYVWFDAPIAYISFTRELGHGMLDAYWKDPSSKIVHFLGKDNIPFHTIFWPAMLLAHGGFNLPTNVVGYNYLLYEGQKFSKSKGIGVFCYPLLTSDMEIDTLRGYLTTIIPETKDASFKWDDYATMVNGEIIGKFGNFFNRTLNLINKFFDGALDGNEYATDDEAARVIDAMKSFPPRIAQLILEGEIRKAFSSLMEYSSIGNVYIDHVAPWKQIKNSRADARKTLYLALNLSRSLAITAAPFFPATMQKLWKEQLNLAGSPDDSGIWDTATSIGIPREHRIGTASPLYSKIDDTKLDGLKKHFSQAHSLREIIDKP